jgi:hypothetical protein
VLPQARLAHALGDQDVDVVAAEEGVARRRQDLEDVAGEVEQGDVERPAAEVVDGDPLGVAAAKAVRERSRGGLVEDAVDLDPATRPATLVAARCRSLKLAGTVRRRAPRLPERLLRELLGLAGTKALISGSV